MENLHKVFELTAQAHPNRIAVEDGDAAVTYQELNKCANRLSHVLRTYGATKDIVVTTITRPGIKLVSSLLATMKSGSIYMPVDISLPEKRLAQIFETTFSGLIVTERSLKETVEQLIDELNVPAHTVIVIEDNLEITAVAREEIPLQAEHSTPKEDNPNLLIEGSDA